MQTQNSWSGETRRWIIIGLVIAAALIVYAIRDTLSTIIVAFLVAYLLNPLVTLIENRLRVRRILATVIVYLGLIALLVIAGAFLVPMLYRQILAFASGFDHIIEQISAAARQLPILDTLGIHIESSTIADQLRTSLGSLASSASRALVTAVSGVFNTIIILVFSLYLVKDAPTIDRALENAVPENYREDVQRIKTELGNIWSSFLRGQVLLAIIIGVITTVVLSILGVRNAVLLGLLAGVLEVVPTIGPIIAMIPAVLIAFFQGSIHWALDPTAFALIVVVAYLLIQQAENHLIVPNVLGSSVNLPPIIILFGAFAGANLAGILGIFLAPPVLATARLILQYVLRKLFEPLPE
ncbi:MAG: AI-2E family transporter [Chloroflexi bacterium]|nr:AI-2E family transporter [Chloroflexota bacterium]